MSTLGHLRSGFSRALDSISEGWNELVERTGSALTRFHLPRSGSGVETPEDRVARDGVRWGVLAAKISVDDESAHVAMEVPGMNKDCFDIQLVNDVLVIRGEKKVERESSSGRYYVMERAYGRFERAIELPVAVSDSDVKAQYKRGVLRITMPRRSDAKVRRIEVRGS
jgi:HSP20 family protein